MQLCLIFLKTLMKKNWKTGNFKVLIDVAVFQRLRKLRKKGGGKFIFFLSLFLSVHINFQYKLKYHTSFYRNFLFIFFYCFTHFFSSAISLFFFSLIFYYKLDEYVQMSSLTGSAFFLRLISIQIINFEKKQAKTFSI